MNAINEIYNYYVLESTATAEKTLNHINERIEWFNELLVKGLPVIVAESNGAVIGWVVFVGLSTEVAFVIELKILFIYIKLISLMASEWLLWMN